jgi:hypothetical protein
VPWNEADDERLRQLAPTHTIRGLGKVFGRSVGAVQRRVRDLDLRTCGEVPKKAVAARRAVKQDAPKLKTLDTAWRDWI